MFVLILCRLGSIRLYQMPVFFSLCMHIRRTKAFFRRHMQHFLSVPTLLSAANIAASYKQIYSLRKFGRNLLVAPENLSGNHQSVIGQHSVRLAENILVYL